MPVYARHTLQTTPHFNPVDVAVVNGVANALKQWRTVKEPAPPAVNLRLSFGGVF